MDSALYYFDKSITKYKNLNVYFELHELYNKKAAIYKKNGDTIKQMESLKLALENLEKDRTFIGNTRKKLLEEIIKDYEEKTTYSNQKQTKYKFLLYLSIFIILATMTFSYDTYRKKTKILVNTTTKKKELESKINNEFEELFKLSSNDVKLFLIKFKKLNANFISALKENHPTITNNDIELIAFLCMQFDSKEIAQSLNLSHRTIQTRKYRLRKKIGIDGEVEFLDYFKTIG